jgi:hypothetical protein
MNPAEIAVNPHAGAAAGPPMWNMFWAASFGFKTLIVSLLVLSIFFWAFVIHKLMLYRIARRATHNKESK